MNRQSLTISAALLAVVIVVFGVFVFFGKGSDSGPEPITGPGRASEARSIIQDIQQRQSNEATPAPVVRQPQLIERPAAEAQPASAASASNAANAGGAAAVTPAPTPPAPAGANAELDAAYEQALELRAAGQLDDAQVLLYFGALKGHPRSAFAYAEMNDPIYYSPEVSPLGKADAYQAYRFYSVASEGGLADAADRLEALRLWAVDAAAAGDTDAERVLLQWK
jgi:hypothetical protein